MRKREKGKVGRGIGRGGGEFLPFVFHKFERTVKIILFFPKKNNLKKILGSLFYIGD